MGKLSLKDKACIFISLVLALVSSAAEREYFTQDLRNVTWGEARNHCQVCFKELVTVTPENIKIISQNLTLDYWVGLRKKLNSTSNSSVSWSRWANGDPLTFQNWYPGKPVLRSSLPTRYCCSCSASTTPTSTPTSTPTPTTRSFTTASTDFTSPGVTNSTKLEDATATDKSTFTEFTSPGVTSFTELEDSTSTDKSNLTEFTSPGVTSFTELEDSTSTDKSNLTEFTSPGVTSFTELEDSTSTDKSNLTEFTSPGVTSFTELTDTNVKLTDVTKHIGLWGSTTQKTPPAPAAPWALMDEQCERSPMLPSDVPVDYIEDSCVAMLSFGAWVERDCSALLPFICYEDPFFGQANVIEITSESTVVTWQRGPGAISHYLIEFNDGKEVKQFKTKDLRYDFGKLTAGVRHSVQVFPVKCGRRLNPQEVAFYTTPNKVEELRVDNVTETSVFLRWNEPAGNVDFYLIKVQGGKRVQSRTERAEVDGLIPGNLHMFTIFSGVKDNSTWSEAANITAYTKPRKVTDLKVTENTNTSLLVSWTPPVGNSTGFWVTATNESNDVLFDEVVSTTNVRLTNLTAGCEVTFSVTALTDNNTLPGDTETVVDYTVPGTISDLTLVAKYNSIDATWKVTSGGYSSFTVKLQLEGKNIQTIHNITELRKHFDGLKTGARYTVIVNIVSGDLKGPTARRSTFTKLLPPTNISIDSFDKNRITVRWEAPDNIAAATYSVRINSSFWGHSWSVTVQDNTTHTFHDLKPGTRYDIEVRTERNGTLSIPSRVPQCTVAEKREISLSMMCSSAEPLLCDQTTTRDSVFQQLHDHFYELLGDNVFWKLEKDETENK